MLYSIPLSALGASGKSIDMITFQEIGGSAGSPIYLGDVKFVNPDVGLTPTAAPTLTAASPSPSPNPTATPVGAQTYTIYDDALNAAWWDESWDAALDFANGNPVDAGSHSIAYTATAASAGLDLGTIGVSTAGYDHLTLALRASQSGQKFAIFLRGGRQLHAPVPISNYGGPPPTGYWMVYSIPLADLGAGNTNVTSIVIHEWSGTVQQTIFVDDIQFVAGSGLAGPATVAEATSGSVPAVSRTVIVRRADRRRLSVW